MQKHKRIILALVLTVAASAVALARVNNTFTATLTQGSSATNTVPLGAASKISVQLCASNNEASTDLTLVQIDTSNDGITWQSAWATMSLANAGTLTASTISNFTVGAVAQLRVVVSNNTGDPTLTNSVKITINGKGRSNP